MTCVTDHHRHLCTLRIRSLPWHAEFFSTVKLAKRGQLGNTVITMLSFFSTVKLAKSGHLGNTVISMLIFFSRVKPANTVINMLSFFSTVKPVKGEYLVGPSETVLYRQVFSLQRDGLTEPHTLGT
jgi:hypothetical protein